MPPRSRATIVTRAILRTVTAGALLTACAAGPDDQGLPASDGGGYIPITDSGALTRCRGNRDGVIDRSEMAFVPNVAVRYRINPTGTLARVTPNGSLRQDGSNAWDFTDRSGEILTITLRAASQQWFASSFTDAQYAAPIDPRAPELGVYRVTDSAVQLLGVAGPTQQDDTLVHYASPVDILRFPLSLGTTWMAETTTLDGRVSGTPVASRDRYTVTVDARGEVRLPELTFPDVLRLKVELSQSFPAGPGRRRLQYLYVTECYGEVARIVSRDDESDPSFTLAAEFRRLGL